MCQERPACRTVPCLSRSSGLGTNVGCKKYAGRQGLAAACRHEAQREGMHADCPAPSPGPAHGCTNTFHTCVPIVNTHTLFIAAAVNLLSSDPVLRPCTYDLIHPHHKTATLFPSPF